MIQIILMGNINRYSFVCLADDMHGMVRFRQVFERSNNLAALANNSTSTPEGMYILLLLLYIYVGAVWSGYGVAPFGRWLAHCRPSFLLSSLRRVGEPSSDNIIRFVQSKAIQSPQNTAAATGLLPSTPTPHPGVSLHLLFRLDQSFCHVLPNYCH